MKLKKLTCVEVTEMMGREGAWNLDGFYPDRRDDLIAHLSSCRVCAEKYNDVEKVGWDAHNTDPSLVETSTIVIEGHTDPPRKPFEKQHSKINQALHHFIHLAAEFSPLESLETDAAVRRTKITEAINGLGSFFYHELLDLVPKVPSDQGQLKVKVLVRMEFIGDLSTPPLILMDWMAGTQSNMNLFPVAHADFRGLAKAVKPYVSGDDEMRKTALLALLYQLHIFSKIPADLFGSPLRVVLFARSINVTIFIVHLELM